MTATTARRAEALAFATAFVTLFAQILVHRMVSLKLLNNFAFLVISLTMLGFALSGVVLSRWLPDFLEARDEVLTSCAASFALTLVAGSCLFYRADAPGGSVASMLSWLPPALLYAVPFAFCGLMLGLLLSSPDLPTSRVYGADLAGSAAGAFAVIPAIRYLGVEASAVAAGAGLVIVTSILARPRRPLARGLVVAAVCALALAAARPADVFRLRYRQESMLRASEDPRSGFRLEHTAWDPLARIEISTIPPPDPETMGYPSLIGENRRFLSRFRRMLTQNDYAFTYAVDYDGTPESLLGIEQTIYSAAYQAAAVDQPRALVIGVGGGFDILTALAFEAREVIGLEVNAATLGIITGTYRDYFRAWAEHPHVRLVSGEGRHYLATSDQRFDVIQLSGVDSYSGTPGAANVFSESYLYTAEAFDLYLRRLTEDGILNMMRLEFPQPREMLRALVTAVAALRRTGVERPEEHIVTVTQTNGMFTALLVKRTPFLEPELRRLEAWVAGSRFFHISASPGRNAAKDNLYQVFLSLKDASKEAAFVRVYPYDVSAAEDDRPFFFKYSRWAHLFPRTQAFAVRPPFMEISVLVLLVLIGLVGSVGVLLPLRHFARQGLRAPEARRFMVFFAGTGVGYLAIEIALLQKFGLLLGHPNYALSVVLAALLLSTGAGSLLSRKTVATLGGLRFVVYLLAGVMLIEYTLFFPRLSSWIALPFATRVLIVFALAGALGICLGTFVPVALERMKESAPSLVPWAWGVNGIASVVAPVLAAAFSMTWGINALFLSAIPVYLLVGFASPSPGSARAPA
jgi:spermidine synthase